jgi:phage/plasmid-associated DNA primase
MIEGAYIFISQGFSFSPLPDCVAEETSEYRFENNWIANFVDCCCECKPGVFARAGELYATYVVFAKERGEDAKSQPEFSAALIALGHTKMRRNIGVTYNGLCIRPRNI